MSTPEELARVNIDKQLEAAGWIVQDFIVLNLGEGQGLVVQEFRTYHNQHIVEEELKKHGVRIEYVLGEYSDTPEGNFMKNIRATVAEYERLKITERNVRGRIRKVKSGSVMTHGQTPYGYRLTLQRDFRVPRDFKPRFSPKIGLKNGSEIS